MNCETQQSGIGRVQNDSAEGYLLWIGTDALPNLDNAANGFSATLPLNVAYALPGSEEVLNIIAKYRNSYGVVSQNQQPYLLTLDTGGIVEDPLDPPTEVAVFPVTDKVRVRFTYQGFETDTFPADKVRIWVGVTMPDPDIDTPTEEADISQTTNTVTFGTYSPGTYIVLVALYRTSSASRSDVVESSITFEDVPDVPEVIAW